MVRLCYVGDLQRHRAVVGALDIRQDVCLGDVFPDAVRHQKIVNAPASILGPGLEAVGPPGIEDLFRVQAAEAVQNNKLVHKLNKI